MAEEVEKSDEWKKWNPLMDFIDRQRKEAGRIKEYFKGQDVAKEYEELERKYNMEYKILEALSDYYLPKDGKEYKTERRMKNPVKAAVCLKRDECVKKIRAKKKEAEKLEWSKKLLELQAILGYLHVLSEKYAGFNYL